MKYMLWLMLFVPSFALAAPLVPLSGVDDVTPNISVETQQIVNDTVMNYYKAPSVEKVNTVLDVMNDSNMLRKKTAWAPIIGFLTVVFQDNKAHVMEWMSRNDYNTWAEDVFVSALMHAKLKDDALTFAAAHQWKKADLDRIRATADEIDLKHLPVVLPGHIDTLWGAFFASGDPVYVNEIIDVVFMHSIPYSKTVSAPVQYDVLGESKNVAEVTLKRYAPLHPVVHEALEKRLKGETDEDKRKALTLLLTPAK